MLLFCQERAFDKKLIVSAAVPITPYKKFMKEKPLPKKLLELHWGVFLQQTPYKTEALPAGDIHGIPQEQFHRLRRGAVSLMLFKNCHSRISFLSTSRAKALSEERCHS